MSVFTILPKVFKVLLDCVKKYFSKMYFVRLWTLAGYLCWLEIVTRLFVFHNIGILFTLPE